MPIGAARRPAETLAAQSRLVGNEDVAWHERGPTRIRKRRAGGNKGNKGNKDDRGDSSRAGDDPGDYYGSPSHVGVSFAPGRQGYDAGP
jgi:hypothetical protein